MSLKDAGKLAIDTAESLKQVNSAISAINASQVFYDTKNIDQIIASTAGLTTEQAAQAVVTAGLTDEYGFLTVAMAAEDEVETAAALATKGMTTDKIRLAMANLGYKDTVIDSTIATIAESDALKAGAGSAGGFNLALKGLWTTLASNPIFWVVAALTALIAAFKIAEKYIDNLTEDVQQLSDLTDNIKSLNDEIDTTTKQIDELNESINELLLKDSLTLVEQEQLNKLQQQNDLLKTTLDLKQQELKLNQEKAVKEAQDILDSSKSKNYFNGGTYTDVDEGVQTFGDKLKSYIARIGFAYAASQSQQASNGIMSADAIETNQQALSDLNKELQEYSATDYIEHINEEFENGNEITTTMKANLLEIAANFQTITDNPDLYGTEQAKEAKGYLEDISNLLNGINLNTNIEKALDFGGSTRNDKVNTFLNDNSNAKREILKRLSINGEINEDDIKDIFKEYANGKETLDELKSAFDGNKNYLSLFVQYLNGSAQAASDAADSVDDVTDSVSSLSDAIKELDDVAKGIKALDTAFGELKNEGKVNYDTISSILDSFSEVDGIDAYVKELASAGTSTNRFKEILNELTYAKIKQKMSDEDIVASGEDVIATMLRSNGVTNAAAVAHDMVTQANARLIASNYDVADSASWTASKLEADAAAAGLTKAQFVNLIATERIFSNQGISIAQKLQALETLANALGVTNARAITLKRQLASLSSGGGGHDPDAFTNNSTTALKLSEEAFKEVGEVKSTNVHFGGSSYKGGSGGGSGGGGGGNSSTKKEKSTLDWIETKISRIERQIKNLARTAESAFKTFTTRNKALKNEISKVNREIEVQQKAYKYYMKEANKVKLSKSLKEKVKNGSININDYSENTAKKIKEFQELYEKALAAKDAVADLKEKLAELYKTSFDNKVDEYDSKLARIEHQANLVNASIKESELKGYRASANYYLKLQEIESKNIKQLEAEYKALVKARDAAVDSGTIKKGSQAYNDMTKEIEGVSEALVEANNNLLEYANNIRDIKWDNFDYLEDTISQITDESDFLIDLMSNSDMFKDGKITDQGKATMGLHGLNYNTYMEQSIDYANQIKEIEAEIAKNPYDTALIDRRRELIETQREFILNAENEKQALKDLVEEGINSELDALKELIDKYNELMDSQKDMYDYQKNVKEQTEEIASLQKQLVAYGSNTTDEGKLKRQQLSNSLKEAQEKLQETFYDRYISDQKKLLDDFYNDYELTLNKRLDNIDELVLTLIKDINSNSNDIQSILAAEAGKVGISVSDSIQGVFSSGTPLTTYFNNINGFARNYWTGLNEALAKINAYVAGLQNAADANAGGGATPSNGRDVNDYLAEQSGTMGTYKWNGNGTVEYTDKNGRSFTFQHSANKTSFRDPVSGQTSTSAVTLAGNSEVLKAHKYINSYGSPIYSATNTIPVNYTSEKGKKAAFQFDRNTGKIIDPKTGESANSVEALVKKKAVKQAYGFKKGVYNISDSQFAWTQEDGKQEYIVRKSDGAILTPLNKGDSVLNSRMTDNIWKMANNPSQYILDHLSKLQGVDVSRISPSVQTINNQIDLDVTLPNVTNYDEFVRQAQKDPKFEKLIQAMTIGRVNGKSSLSKYNINIG